MPKVYEHPNGGLVADLEDGLDVLVETKVEPGADPVNQIATDPIFNLAGQGITPEEARDSLASVLADHIYYYLKEGVLKEVLESSPWRETGHPEEAIARLQKGFRERFESAIQFTINKADQ